MVLEFFKLQEHPFGVTPDSKFLFLGDTHREALGSLLYGIEAGCGFVGLIATPGLGKTTLLFHAMNQLREKARSVLLFQTVCTPLDLLRALLSGLGICDFKGNLAELQLQLRDVLLEQYRIGKRVVLVIDEAQNLDDSVLEMVRMLSNFETSQQKLIQIVLCGQPQLAEKIGSPALVQLRQRVSIIAHLKPFSPKETAAYIEHRLRVAGYAFDVPLFTRDALALIAQHSEGIPRNINNLGFNALALACAMKQKPVDAGIIREVVSDLSLDRFRKPEQPAPAQSSRLQPDRSDDPSLREPGAWKEKVAVAATVLVVIGGALLAIHPWRNNGKMANAHTVTQAVLAAPTAITAGDSPVTASPVQAARQPAPPQPAPAAKPAAPASGPQPAINLVTVTPGKTLLRICIDSFGKCNAAALQEIHRLNPELGNMDHIETGQSIRVPATTEQAAKAIAADGNSRE
jgi:type II secretory pathway predicted ATPase ExeA